MKCKLEKGAATAPEKFLDIFAYFVVVVAKLKKIFFSFFSFLFFSIFSLLLSFKLPHYSPITPPLSFSYIFMIFFQLGKKNCFSCLFLFFFFLFFPFACFLSYFLLKSSNTPLLFLNFHFHLNITLQKKKEKKKKKRERSPIFKLNSIYLSKFWVFVSVFKYFISKSLTSTLIFLIFVYQYVI